MPVYESFLTNQSLNTQAIIWVKQMGFLNIAYGLLVNYKIKVR